MQFKCQKQFNVKQFSLTCIHGLVLFNQQIGPYLVLPGCTWEQWQWRGTLHSPKLQHYWSLNIRLLSVISGIFVGGVLSLFRGAVGVFCRPSWLGQNFKWNHREKYSNNITTDLDDEKGTRIIVLYFGNAHGATLTIYITYSKTYTQIYQIIPIFRLD